VVRTRLLRVRRNWRILVTTSTRTLREPESFKLTLRSPSVRRLRPGRYEVEVAMGRTRQTLHSPATRGFTIVG
jgi:hypothetical protein